MTYFNACHTNKLELSSLLAGKFHNETDLLLKIISDDPFISYYCWTALIDYNDYNLIMLDIDYNK